MNISAISMLPLQGATNPSRLADDPARLAKEFDAMVLRLMLGDLGKSMGTGGDSEVLGQVLAEQLAATVELGFGAALVREATGQGTP